MDNGTWKPEPQYTPRSGRARPSRPVPVPFPSRPRPAPFPSRPRSRPGPVPSRSPYRRSAGLPAGSQRRHVGTGGGTTWRGRKGPCPARARPGARPCGLRLRPRMVVWVPLALRGVPGAAAGCGHPSWMSRCSAAPRGPARRRPPSLRPGRLRRLPQPAAPGPGLSAGERWLRALSRISAAPAFGARYASVSPGRPTEPLDSPSPGSAASPALGRSRSDFPHCNQHVFLRLSPSKVPKPRSVLL